MKRIKCRTGIPKHSVVEFEPSEAIFNKTARFEIVKNKDGKLTLRRVKHLETQTDEFTCVADSKDVIKADISSCSHEVFITILNPTIDDEKLRNVMLDFSDAKRFAQQILEIVRREEENIQNRKI